jgi:hypothetical protein
MSSRKAFVFGLLPFIVLATLNAGGYRYGASDQAFYQPAVLVQLDPDLFPRDVELIDVQAKLTTYDEVIASFVRVTGVSLPTAFAVLYVVALVLIALGTWVIGRRLYIAPWTTAALLAAMTLRHAIARSGTNTLEGYFHPRQLAFGFGLLAVGAFLHRRYLVTLACVLAAAAVHPTAALWFGVWLGTAAAIADERPRRFLLHASLPMLTALGMALVAGPLEGRLAVMDDAWLRTLATKDYLFILEWPLYAWIFNLGYLLLVAAIFRHRDRARLVGPQERALVLGSLALVAVFVVAVVTQALHIILAFQLQPARLFLIFDFLATAYVVWALAEMRIGGNMAGAMRPVAAATFVVLFSCARGAYVLEQAQRAPVQIGLGDDDWGRVMAWARGTPKSTGWLADPMHAIIYGTSVRVAGERDVFVEGVKDAALGIYDRRIAMRTDTRMRELNDFNRLSAEKARSLASRYDLDFLVTENTLDLPLAFESGSLRVYQLR